MSEFAAAGDSGETEKDPMPTMGFLDHLEELRKRLVHSIIAVAIESRHLLVEGGVALRFHAEADRRRAANGELAQKLVFLNPTDPFNLYLKIAALAGLFLTSPYVLYQVWMFISPGLYRNEKRYVVPFMVSTITLFTTGGDFGYGSSIRGLWIFLIGFGKQFQPMITIGEYTQLFLSVVLGMGLDCEMPILVFFLAFMGIMSPEFMIKNFRYSILVIFIIAAIVTPTPDIVNMCVFAAPMLILYALSIGVAYAVHPKRRQARKEKQASWQ